MQEVRLIPRVCLRSLIETGVICEARNSGAGRGSEKEVAIKLGRGLHNTLGRGRSMWKLLRGR